MGDNQGSQSEEDFDEVLEINEAIAQLGITGIPLAKSLGLTEKDLSFMLTVARKYFAAKDYGATASLYLLLVVLDYSRAGSWVKLGIAEHLGRK
ncbi:MAG: hypothetical protein KDK78_12415, partial [Chlamydiia bacterium]|nr:hypothetical protein [Chlamydiia bacterium]